MPASTGAWPMIGAFGATSALAMIRGHVCQLPAPPARARHWTALGALAGPAPERPHDAPAPNSAAASSPCETGQGWSGVAHSAARPIGTHAGFAGCRLSHDNSSRASPLHFGTSGRGHPPARALPRCAHFPSAASGGTSWAPDGIRARRKPRVSGVPALSSRRYADPMLE